jgi:chromosome partitioning protein
VIIPIINQKGGTGKTTTVINLAKGLSMHKKKVLLIDIDSQGNLTFSLGHKASESITGKVLATGIIEENDIVVIDEYIHLIPTTTDLVNFEFEFIKQSFDYNLIKKPLNEIKNNYDYVLIDCPPSGGFLTINALIAGDAVLIPMQMDVLSLQGLEQLLESLIMVKQNYNPSLYVLGVLGVMVDGRRQLTNQILERIRKDYGLSIFNNFIRNNVRAAEAPSFGQSVIEYAPNSTSATDYLNVTKEFIFMTK